jgi:hypothetical protein
MGPTLTFTCSRRLCTTRIAGCAGESTTACKNAEKSSWALRPLRWVIPRPGSSLR